jgi:UDP-N-acetylglucosamine diphosphorylase/glucosamine-1-phosphate N-acetyltransferase
MTLPFQNIAVVILAAGLGTRMKSRKAKVLHEVLDRPMIHYVVDVAAQIAAENVVLVVGHQADRVRKIVSARSKTEFAHQAQQLGTGHAVQCALPLVPAHCAHVVILCGDVPSITVDTLKEFVSDHIDNGHVVSVLAARMDTPTGYGRILMDAQNRVTGIVEEADASEAQRSINIINTGIYCVEIDFLDHALRKIDTNNAQGELYLTDIIGIGHRENKPIGAVVFEDHREFLGVNSNKDLAVVEKMMRDRLTDEL